MNDPTQFHTEDRAVSSVIGTILLVAIVVIVGSVVTGAALGVTLDIPSPTPQASFEFTPDDETGDIIVTNVAGETVPGDQLKFSGAALEKTTYGSVTEWAGKNVRAGDSASVDVRPDETLRLVWQSPNGLTEAILAEYDVPDDVGPRASIGGITANSGENKITINNIQFSRVTDETVYVVVEKRRDGIATNGRINRSNFSTKGGDLVIEDLRTNNGGNIIEVTIYETNKELFKLEELDSTVSGGGGPARPGRRR